VLLQELEQRRVSNQADLDGLGHPRASLAERQGREQELVVQHRVRGREGAEQVLGAVSVHPRLDAHAAVTLREHGARQSHAAHAAVEDRRNVARRVEHRSASDHEHRRVTIEVLLGKARAQSRHERGIVLARFTARQPRGLTPELQHRGVGASVGDDASLELRLCVE
jgi:hypothetical protein